MAMDLDPMDMELLAMAESDMDVCARPFDGWARALGLQVEEVVGRLEALKRMGVIREVKAVLRHDRSGIGANAMVAWAVPASDVEEAGRVIASFDQVSHCYERSGFEPYTVFSMIHAATDGHLMETVRAVSEAAGLRDYKVFRTVRELKKTSMRYFGAGG
jgi:DNA-binding Lrp family transcriptional regulator